MRTTKWLAIALFCGLAFSSQQALAGPKVKVKECKCSINIPKKWFVLKYSKTDSGLEYLVTSAPNPDPQTNNVPGLQFLRHGLDMGAAVSPEDVLRALAKDLADVSEVTEPSAGKLGKTNGATLDVTYGNGVKQRYYSAIKNNMAYILILSWRDPLDMEKLEEAAKSVDL